jgi:murein DD-endopeptidase MepM/ murein hydrolase activator NlpD
MKIPFLAFSLFAILCVANAATLKVTPQNPQPGDVLSVTIYPAPGETISGIGMAAFDTPQVKFFSRADGSARAFVGFPFDRSAGTFPLRARVQTNQGEQILSSQIVARARNYPTQRITMRNRATASKMNNTAALRAERIYVQSRMKESYAAPLWSGSWLTPSRGTPSSPYGRRRYVNGKWWGQHNGSDIKAPAGTSVVASNSGRVVLSEYLPALRGNCVVLDHGCNVFSLYLHLSKRDVAVGQNVARGQQIGRVGSTGFSTGPHLHWEVRVGWEPVDPVKIVSQGLKF